MPFMTPQDAQQLRHIEMNAAERLHNITVQEVKGGFLLTVITRYLDPEDTVIGQVSDEYVAKSNCELYDYMSKHVPPYVDAVQELTRPASPLNPPAFQAPYGKPDIKVDGRSIVPDPDYVAELEAEVAARRTAMAADAKREPIGEDQQD